MDSQFIIVVSHQCGSGGKEAAELLAEKLGVKLYSKSLAEEMVPLGKITYCVDENGFIAASPKSNGEMNAKLKRCEVMGTFSFIRSCAESGESFIVLESCADYYLSDLDCVTRFFLTADDAWRTRAVSNSEGISEKEAKKFIRRTEHNRRAFHDRYCKTRWGTEKCYDYVIDCTGQDADAISDRIIRLANIRRILS